MGRPTAPTTAAPTKAVSVYVYVYAHYDGWEPLPGAFGESLRRSPAGRGESGEQRFRGQEASPTVAVAPRRGALRVASIELQQVGELLRGQVGLAQDRSQGAHWQVAVPVHRHYHQRPAVLMPKVVVATADVDLDESPASERPHYAAAADTRRSCQDAATSISTMSNGTSASGTGRRSPAAASK